MNINQLAKSLSDRAVGVEVITWLRDNELLADNSGNIATDTKLAEQFAQLLPGRKRNISSLAQNINRREKVKSLTSKQAQQLSDLQDKTSSASEKVAHCN